MIETVRGLYESNHREVRQLDVPPKPFGNDLKAWEDKDETIDFPLKEITPTKVVFEGMTFEKISDHEMNVYVDIKQDDGSIKNVKFNYTK